MAGSGGEVPLPSAANGGEFLLTLLQKSQPHQQQQSPLQTSNVMPQQQPQLQPSLPMDPAVAAVGPTLPSQPSMPSNVRNLPGPWPQAFSPPLSSNFLGFPQNLWASPGSQFTGSSQNLWTSPGSQFTGNQGVLLDDFRRIGISGVNNNSTHVMPNMVQPKQQEQKFVFGSLPNDIPLRKHQGDGNLLDNSRLNLSNHQLNSSQETRGRLPPGFPGKFRGGLNPDFGMRHFESTMNKGKTGNRDNEAGLTDQFDQPGSPSGSNLLSVPATDIEESLLELHCDGDRADNQGGEVNELREQLLESDDKKQYRREKESRIDNRGERILTQRMRMLKRQMDCRNDIQQLNAPFLAIYESLIPAEEERTKQKQLLALLQKLVSKEWPEGRLYLYGSCANTFGVSKSDIDICLAINEDVDKSEVLLKLADIFQSDNLQNVQALTRARVPIVKLMDPTTGISCDICINNVLAVINTKLLRDYGKIDGRLRQLAFIVKHWAKSRGVNETYQGTLSSYAYVLMCIHFLQQRRPAILPCLQLMEKTYSVTTDNVECAYFDQVEKLRNFGSSNKETISQLVWAFFNYWAYGHDYSNWAISVRTGSILSKREKDWTRRIGNDRHLICIEDPFETSHDLGRVVDKFSIRVLREEFERAAEIMQYDPYPSVTLFERYVPS